MLKTLKQRFAIWYNARHERYGTLWAERFTSSRVEGSGMAMRIVAAYIDLNPVRAKLVKDPRDYPFCGYAQALAGIPGAREGVRAVIAEPGMEAREALETYRCMLFSVGASPKRKDPQAGYIDRERVREVEALRGALPQSFSFLQRMRCLSQGAAFGSVAFVEALARPWQLATGRKRLPKPQLVHEPHSGDGRFATLRRLWG